MGSITYNPKLAFNGTDSFTYNDLVAGNAGDDLLTGSGGEDRFLFKSNSAFDTADFGSDRITDFTIGTEFRKN